MTQDEWMRNQFKEWFREFKNGQALEVHTFYFDGSEAEMLQWGILEKTRWGMMYLKRKCAETPAEYKDADGYVRINLRRMSGVHETSLRPVDRIPATRTLDGVEHKINPENPVWYSGSRFLHFD